MLILILLLGLAAGVAINGLADNLPPDAADVRRGPGAPRCPHCVRTHRPAYWLALAALVSRRGRCEHCGAPRRARHLWLELGTAASLALAWQWAGASAAGLGRFLPAAVILVVFWLIVVIDVEHRLILWEVILPAAVIVGLMNSLLPERGPQKTLLGGLAGYALWYGIFLAAQGFAAVAARLRGAPLEEVAFGGGDVNLGGVVGLTVGWTAVLFSVPITILSAAAFSLVYLLVQSLRRRYTLFTPIPYGPFMVLGALVMYFYGQEFAAWYMGG